MILLLQVQVLKVNQKLVLGLLALCILFLSKSGYSAGFVFQKDTLVVFRLLPTYFDNAFSKNECYLDRDKILTKLKSDKVKYRFISNFFYLENKYVQLFEKANNIKPLKIFYVYLNPQVINGLDRDYGRQIKFQNNPNLIPSYLDVGDYIVTRLESIDSANVMREIQSGRLEQNKRIKRFRFKFYPPPSLEKGFSTTSGKKSKMNYYGDVEDPVARPRYEEVVVKKNLRDSIRDDTLHDQEDIIRSNEVRNVIDQEVFTVVENNEYGDDYDENSVFLGMRIANKDSLNTLISNTKELLNTFKYFEKTYLQSSLFIRFLPTNHQSKWGNNTYYKKKELLNTKPNRLTKQIIAFDEKCKRFLISKHNTEHFDAIKRYGFASIGPNQMAQTEYIEDLSHLVTVYLDPRLIADSVWAYLFYKPELDYSIINNLRVNALEEQFDIRSKIYSNNHRDSELKNFEIPPLLEKWNKEILDELIMSLKTPFHEQVKEVRLSYNYKGNDKLWMRSDLNRNKIYISPLLIRDAFLESLYEQGLFSLVINNSIGSLMSIKSGYTSIKEIQELYEFKIFHVYKAYFSFILAHELAHFYVVSKSKLEQACDCYSFINLKRNYNKPILGAFESMMLKAIDENVIDFWGNGVDKAELIERYKLLKSYMNMDLDTLELRCRLLAN